MSKHYNRIANERTAAQQAQYKAWIESHTPEQIREANAARAMLRRKHKLSGKELKTSQHPSHTSKLIDERQPKHPGSPFTVFTKIRFASGDFKNIRVIEAIKLVANEWKALSADEKKVRSHGCFSRFC